MEESGTLAVLEEEHLADEGLQAVLDIVLLRPEILLDLPLRVELLLEGEYLVFVAVQVLAHHLLGVLPEHLLQLPVSYIRCGVAGEVKPESEGEYLPAVHRQGRGEMPHQSLGLLLRNLPYPEKSQHVVYPVGVEVLRHVAETLFPPAVAVFGHSVPVVCGESPVLTLCRKVVGRGSGLGIHVEELRGSPCVRAVAGDAYGNVSLQGNAQRMEVLHRIQQLPVQVVLGEDMEGYFRVKGAVLRVDAGEQSRGAARVLSPLGKIGCAVAVPQGAEGAVGQEPGLVAAVE